MWFITAIDSQYHRRGAIRTFGFFKNISDAQSAVENNQGEMHECLYDYLVLEKIDCGIHPLAQEEIWYTWKDERWTPCEEPEWANATTNWALG